MKWITFIFVLVAGQAFADVTASGHINIFDDKVFDEEKLKDEEKASKALSGKNRYVDRTQEPINIKQRKIWLEACEPVKGDPKAFKKCYRNKRKAAGDEVEAQAKRVEDAQAAPLKTAPQLYLDELKRDPAGED